MFLFLQLEEFSHLHQTSVGYRPGRQCLDIVGYLNDLLDKAYEWKLPGEVISLDIESAFDNTRPELAAKTLHQCGAPAELVCGLVRELTELEASPSLAFCRTRPVPYGKGARQGGPRTPALWNELVVAALEPHPVEVATGNRRSITWDIPELEGLEEHSLLVWADSMFLFVTSEQEANRRIE